MAGVMMALGDYRFSLDTAAYDKLNRESEYRWPLQDRLTVQPAAQFLGPGAEKISLSGSIFPHFRGGLGQLDRMRAEAEKGESLLLTDGRGRVWGRYAVTKIAETQSVFFDDGTPRRIDFSIDLVRYHEDQGGAASPVKVQPETAAPKVGAKPASKTVPAPAKKPASPGAGLPKPNEVNPSTGAPYTPAQKAAFGPGRSI